MIRNDTNDDTFDDNGSDDTMNDYERVKKWREKNKAKYNLYQRNYRKGLRMNSEYTKATHEVEIHGPDENHPQVSKDETLAKLRDLIKQEEEKPTVEARVRYDVVGGIYRNDSGGVISKFAWEKLQKLKEKAKDGGYILDEYSQ